MARDPRLVIDVDADVSGATAGLSKTQAAVVGFSAAAGTALANFAERAIRGAVDMGRAMLDAASDAQQSAGAVAAVFGEYAGSVTANAQQAADAVGLSASAYEQLAAVLGSQLKNAGTPMDQIAGKTDELVKLGADLAATYGGSVSDAVSAVSSLLRGERDPIERYGVSITQASIAAYQAANGMEEFARTNKAAADQQAALGILMEQTGAAQGQFAREADTFAGAQARLNAKWEDAQASLGEALIPLFTIAANALSVFADFAKENSDIITVLVTILGALAAAIWLVNIAMTANPIGLIIVAIGLVIAIIAILILRWEDVVKAFETGAQQIGDFFVGVGRWIAEAWQNMVNAITGVWEGFIGWINGTIDSMIGWIRDAINWFSQLFGAANSANSAASSARSAPAPAPPGPEAFALRSFSAPSAAPPAPVSAAGASVAAATARARLRGADGGGANIVVNGALDPDAVARQIAGLLNRRNGRMGLAAAAGVRS